LQFLWDQEDVAESGGSRILIPDGISRPYEEVWLSKKSALQSKKSFSKAEAVSKKSVPLLGFTPQVGNNLGTKPAENEPKPCTTTQEKA
jgi:hypothetical protein